MSLAFDSTAYDNYSSETSEWKIMQIVNCLRTVKGKAESSLSKILYYVHSTFNKHATTMMFASSLWLENCCRLQISVAVVAARSSKAKNAQTDIQIQLLCTKNRKRQTISSWTNKHKGLFIHVRLHACCIM